MLSRVGSDLPAGQLRQPAAGAGTNGGEGERRGGAGILAGYTAASTPLGANSLMHLTMGTAGLVLVALDLFLCMVSFGKRYCRYGMSYMMGYINI